VVQSAEYVVSQSEDGHVLARATWLVRNERSQYLKVTPPRGLRPLTVRVSGRPALILKEGDSFYVPLEKSIETVQGLLAFPVEVAWIGTDIGWLSSGHARKQARVLTLPAVNAPIQAAKWEVHLPRGWKLDTHPSRSPAARSGGKVGSKLDNAKEQAREAWTNAIDAYKYNDFESAQRWLDASRGYADQTVEKDVATMDNVGRLQSNLDVLLQTARPSTPSSTATLTTSGSASGTAELRAAEDDVLARRVRDLANAKTTDAQLAQARLEEDARKAILAGDDVRAAEALEQVTALAKDIGITEQKESSEQADKLEMYGQVLNETRARSESAAVAAVVAGSKAQNNARALASGRAGSASLAPATPAAGAGQIGAIGAGSIAEDESVPVAKPAPVPSAMMGAKADSAAPAPVAVPEERSFELADAATTDPVTGTFSENFNFDAVEAVADAPEPEVADAEQELSPEFLSRVPSGRSYQSTVAVTAGVVASTPAPNEPVMRPVTQGLPVSGRAKAGEATAPRQKVGPGPDVMDFATEAGASGNLGIGGPSWDGDVDGYENAKKAKKAAPKKEEQKPEVRPVSRPDAPLNRANELNAEREAEKQRAQSHALASRAKANRNLAPDTRVRRSALAVDASPLTPALPLDGALVTHTAALLEAGEFPTFSYSVIADPRSESFKE